MASYRFITRFVLGCAASEVFAAVLNPEAWLPDVDHVREVERISEGDGSGLGRSYTTVVGAAPCRLRWRMTTVAVEPETRFAWVAAGDLEGEASWMLARVTPGTLVTSLWQIRTTPLWLRALAPVASPLFVHNHDRVVRACARGLADHLDTELLSLATEWARAGRTWRTDDGAPLPSPLQGR